MKYYTIKRIGIGSKYEIVEVPLIKDTDKTVRVDFIVYTRQILKSEINSKIDGIFTSEKEAVDFFYKHRDLSIRRLQEQIKILELRTIECSDG
jgi:hypothetical protein